MLIKQTKEMTEAERIASENSNNQYLQALSYVAVGTIYPFAGEKPPDTFMLCDGSALDVTEYPELFDVIGYSYGGAGDTFNLPDLRGRTIVGQNPADNDFNEIGKTGGEKEHKLTVDEMPSHSHHIKVWAFNDVTKEGVRFGMHYAHNNGVLADGGDENSQIPLYNEYSGADQAHNNMQPYAVCNFIIKAVNAVALSKVNVDLSDYYTKEQTDAAIEESARRVSIEAGEAYATKEEVSGTLSNTLKRKYANELAVAVDMNDISPTNKSLRVRVRSKNLLTYPYADHTATINGVTFTMYSDGSVTLNGTSTAATTYYIARGLPIKAYTNYTLSGCPSGGWWGRYFLKLQETNARFIAEDVGQKSYSTPTFISHIDSQVDVFISIGSGQTFSGLTFRPQLEEGLEATEFSKYVEDLMEVYVLKQTKNLFKHALSTSGVYIDTASGTFERSDDYSHMVRCVEVAPNTTYTMTRAGGVGNCVFVTADRMPTFENVPFKYQKMHGTAGVVQFQITTDNNTKYICFDGETWKLQLEVGSVKTDYENTDTSKLFTPEANGEVNGIEELSYNTQFTIGTKGAVLEVEYNRDINKAFEELETLIVNL